MKSPKIKTQKLPKLLRFNNFPIVLSRQPMKSYWGYFLGKSRSIVINDDPSMNDEYLFELVLHEFMHAAIYESRLSLDKVFHGKKLHKQQRKEELLINQLARDVTQLLYRNPELLQLLQEKKKKKHESKQSKAGRLARSLRSQ